MPLSPSHSAALQLFLLGGHIANAQVIQGVTDLSVFQLLAPCASSAISRNVVDLTSSTDLGCGTDTPELQSCICSQSSVSSQVAQNISDGIKSECGRKADEDQSSASLVFSAYCDAGRRGEAFSTPTTNIVKQYITEIDKFNFLAPCAASALSVAVMYSASPHCPESTASLYAPCVCKKPDVVSLVKSAISDEVSFSCHNSEDLKSASELYREYCDMNDGTTSFASLDTPPGDVSYYITALSDYSSLPKCARQAVSYVVLDQTSRECPGGPLALASCVCLKDGMLQSVYSSMTASVNVNCGYSDDDSRYRAIDVLNYYCSAAEGKVVAKVTQTATQSYPTAVEGGSSGSDGPRQTGDGADEGQSGGGGHSISKGALAGAIVGAILGVLAIVGAIVWFILRRRRRAAVSKSDVGTVNVNHEPKSELEAPVPPTELDGQPAPVELQGSDVPSNPSKPSQGGGADR